jgi:hypothetical protein
MASSFILFVSAVLFCYWFKRVEMLLNRPDEQNGALNDDLGKGRNLMAVLRSMFFPALASHTR